jgi:hypothetical protein
MAVRSESHTKRDQDRRHRSGSLRPVAALLPKLTKKALGKHGFSSAGLIERWDSIVGGDLAGLCRPEKLSFPVGKRDGGTLRIRADGGAALELQHLAPQIVERINVFLGYRAVAHLKLVNGPVAARQTAPVAKPAAASPEILRQTAALDQRLMEIDDEGLRDSLRRLGAEILKNDSTEKS